MRRVGTRPDRFWRKRGVHNCHHANARCLLSIKQIERLESWYKFFTEHKSPKQFDRVCTNTLACHRFASENLNMSRTFSAFFILSLGCSILFSGCGWAVRMLEDVTLKFSEPIDIVNKLLADLDSNIESYLGGDRPGQYSLSLPVEAQLMSKNAAADTSKPPQASADAVALNVSVPSATSGNDTATVAPPPPPNNMQELVESLVELDRKLQVSLFTIVDTYHVICECFPRPRRAPIKCCSSVVVSCSAP